MSLSPGKALGSFEIVSQLGVGGMGEVWRARDSKLGREVAIKVLPEAFAKDPDRVLPKNSSRGIWQVVSPFELHR